jgi:hypothetical protein
MLKWIVTAIVVAASSVAYAQDATPRLNPTNWKAITDARIGLVKAALQLTPDQEKYWPALEKAIRERSEARFKRAEAIEARMKQPQDNVDVMELLRSRSDALTQRGVLFKNLVDAWTPLYPTLTPDQKQRLRVLVKVVRELRQEFGDRDDEEEDSDDEE